MATRASPSKLTVRATARAAPRRPPFYAQTSEFSCGPACALMTLSRFGKARTLTRELEFDVWREMNCIGVRGADPWGWAIPLARRGLHVRVVAEATPTFPRAKLIAYGGRKNAEIAEWAMMRAREVARREGVRTEPRTPTLADAAEAVGVGGVAAVLVYLHQAPHWVLAFHVDEKHVHYHDPYETRGGPDRVRTHRQFEALRERAARRGYAPAIVQVTRAGSLARARR